MARFAWRAAAAALGLAAAGGAAQAQSVYSFGDSLSDIGNVKAVTFGLEAGPDYFQGRFSNGFIWTDILSLEIAGEFQRTNPGLIGPFARGRRAGYNFAHGGAVSGNNGLNLDAFFGGRIQGTLLELLPPFVLTEQAEHFRDQRFFFGRTFAAGSDDFATISSGGNDYFNGETDVDFVVGSIVHSLDIIRQNGVRNFIVLDLPNVGDIPARFGDPNQAELNALSQAHNALLVSEIDAFEAARGVDVAVIPVGQLFDMIVDDAANNAGGLFGFTTVAPGAGTSGSCLGDGLVLAACPDTYLFYDDIHPTARAHEIVADLALATLFGQSATATEAGARGVAVAQVQLSQNRLMSARFAAAQAGALNSGTLSDRAGGLAFGDGLSFSETGEALASAPGQVAYFRYIDGFAPGLSELTPGDIAAPDFMQASLTLSTGEYVMTHGADAMLTDKIFLGALVSQSARENTAFQSLRDDAADTYAVYAAYFDGPLSFSASIQGGEVEQSFQRATGFDFAPVATGRARTRHATARLDATYAAALGPARLSADAKLAVTDVTHFGYAETGGLGLVDRTVADQGAAGAAAYLGGAAGVTARLARGWTLGLDLGAGALAADSTEIGFAALLDTPGLLEERLDGNRLFARPVEQAQLGGLVGAGLALSQSTRFSLRADADALITADGARPVAKLQASWRF